MFRTYKSLIARWRPEARFKELGLIALFLAILLCLPQSVRAVLRPEQIVVIANGAVPVGIDLARYYMKQRGVPAQNLILLLTSDKEQISREEYQKKILGPVRSFLVKLDPRGQQIGCLVLMYGVPLHILPPQPTLEEQVKILRLRSRREELQQRIEASEKEDPKAAKTLREESERLQMEILHAGRDLEGASVDSEIALVLEPAYPLEGWLPNKFFLGFVGKESPKMPQNVKLVSRLDGPTSAIVRRVIDDSIQTEKTGLKGKAYFDARWPDKGDKNLSPYEYYDRAIHEAAKVVKKSGKLPVVLDEQERLFQPGEAPDAAFYCGWYSLAKYVDAFTWTKGSVGYHIASAECTTLKNKGSTVWCKRMLEEGIAATLGPVAEPYVQAFPLPQVFFGCLLDGNTLAECYAVSNPWWSWQMVLIGDPLYRPFKNRTNGEEH